MWYRRSFQLYKVLWCIFVFFWFFSHFFSKYSYPRTNFNLFQKQNKRKMWWLQIIFVYTAFAVEISCIPILSYFTTSSLLCINNLYFCQATSLLNCRWNHLPRFLIRRQSLPNLLTTLRTQSLLRRIPIHSQTSPGKSEWGSACYLLSRVQRTQFHWLKTGSI